MLKNHFKTAWRTMLLNRTYSLTNLIGLTLGLMVIMMISTLVLDELSYDQQWKGKDEIYRLGISHFDDHGNLKFHHKALPTGLNHTITAQFSEVVDFVNIRQYWEELSFVMPDDRLIEFIPLETDTNFFNLFEIQAVHGNPRQTMAHANNLVISESAHERYFNNEDVIGRIFHNTPKDGDPQPYVISSIIKDLPQNTHLHAEFFLIGEHLHEFDPASRSVNGQYIQIKTGIDTAQLAARVNTWYTSQLRSAAQEGQPLGRQVIDFQSIKDIHLGTVTGLDSPMRDIYMLSGIAVLILILICINFINLTFAHAIKKTLETGIRKVLGASRTHLMAQMGAESILLFGGALMLAFMGYLLVLPPFEKYIGHPLTQTYDQSPPLFIGLLFFWLTLGLICSYFPAAALSKTKATHELKKQVKMFRLPLNTGFTKGLVAVQFSIAMIVTISMFTIGAQMRFMNNHDLGYHPENLLVVEGIGWEGKGKAFKEMLLQHTSIPAVSQTQWTPFNGSVEITPIENPLKDDIEETVITITSDYDFAETMGISLVEGRYLSPDFAMDAVVYDTVTLQREIYSNALVTAMTAESRGLSVNDGSTTLRHTPVGIINNFHAASLKHLMPQLVILAVAEMDWGPMLIRVADGLQQEALSALHSTWKTIFPDKILRTHWLEDKITEQYAKEQQQFQQMAFFSGISILIALLGILGLTIYTIERKIKEIGIRKVLGASVQSIVFLFSSSFSKLVLVACLIAFPIGWWLMHQWLVNFAYRIDMPVMLFALTGLVTLASMLVVIGWRVLRTAKANPIDSLRDE